MQSPDLQDRCELGQQQLMRMEYLQAEQTLAAVEEIAWNTRDFDLLSRLYMPLQEARRQRRQRCAEGVLRLNLLAREANDALDIPGILKDSPHGQLLIAGWGSIEPALQARRLAAESELYVETFLAAVYPVNAGRIVAIVPTSEVRLPPLMPIDSLLGRLPIHSIVLSESEIPTDHEGAMRLWEQLHAPFLAAADMEADPLRKIEGYRKTIRVDYACELAHQKLADVAGSLCKSRSTI